MKSNMYSFIQFLCLLGIVAVLGSCSTNSTNKQEVKADSTASARQVQKIPKGSMFAFFAQQEAIALKFKQKFDSLTPIQQVLFLTEIKHIMEPEVPKIEAGRLDSDPPSDAIVLFNGKNLDEWEEATFSMKGPGEIKPISWVIKDGGMQPTKTSGTARTKRVFRDFQLHLEWKAPAGLPDSITGQNRGNSGVIIQGLYEVQVLDSYNNRTYRNGQAGAVYMQYAPLVNPSRKAGVWQTYDIIYTAPRYKDSTTFFTPPRITVIYNGVLVQNNVEIQGPTVSPGIPEYKIKEHGDGPIELQQHGNPVTFRNIWIRKL